MCESLGSVGREGRVEVCSKQKDSLFLNHLQHVLTPDEHLLNYR